MVTAAEASIASFVRPDAKAEFTAAMPERVGRLRGDGDRCPGQCAKDAVVRRSGWCALDAGWSDLGAWDAVWQVSPKDANGNATVGDALISDSRDTLVHATSRRVGVVGLDNSVVVETPDAVLVADRERSQ